MWSRTALDPIRSADATAPTSLRPGESMGLNLHNVSPQQSGDDDGEPGVFPPTELLRPIDAASGRKDPGADAQRIGTISGGGYARPVRGRLM